jgi:SAM-dependent methyltransferase
VTEATEWWQRFFTGPWLDLQGSMFDDAVTAAQVARIERMLSLDAGSRLLDVPCGVGRVSLELAARGHRVTGVDITESFLEAARTRAGERGVEIELRHGDMRDLPWKGEFDAVVNWWGSFGYFDEAGNEAFVRAVARALKPGGRFLIEGHLAESLLPIYQPHGWFRVDDVVVLEERRLDMDAARIESTWTFLRDGSPSESRSSSMRVYTFHELSAMLRDAGFERVVAFDSTTAEPFELRKTTRAAVVATKA